MGFGGAVRAGYANYFNFSGRATRPEYWWFQLWLAIIAIATGIFGVMEIGSQPGSGIKLVDGVLTLIFLVLLLGTLIPALSLQIRRLHDSGHTGWWVLASFLAHVAREGWGYSMKTHPGVSMDLVALILDLMSLGFSIAILIFSLQRSKR